MIFRAFGCFLVIAQLILARNIDLHVVLLSQDVAYESDPAMRLRRDLFASSLGSANLVKITLLHENVTDRAHQGVGSWAIWPLLLRFSPELLISRWTLFCSPFTRIPSWPRLLRFLAPKNHSVPQFIGRSLRDQIPVIIHHFASDLHFRYPDLPSGFLLSRELVRLLTLSLRQNANGAAPSSFSAVDFTIDPSFEFAKLILRSTGTPLSSPADNWFCSSAEEIVDPAKVCLTEFHAPDFAECAKNGRPSEPVDGFGVFFAVKTHGQNHGTRIPIIKRTWAGTTSMIRFFSDTEDPEVPSEDLGVPNTQRGHCAKTVAIMRHFLDDGRLRHVRWLVIADDDTLISVPRLRQLIDCVESFEVDTGRHRGLIVGQRYGYGFGPEGTGGYDYPTGGAGMVFSRPAVQSLSRDCLCPRVDSPDDMIIGICARHLDIPIIHSDAFHQAQPDDYPSLHLQSWAGKHISFHKFENLDPYKVYNDLLAESDYEWVYMEMNYDDYE